MRRRSCWHDRLQEIRPQVGSPIWQRFFLVRVDFSDVLNVDMVPNMIEKHEDHIQTHRGLCEPWHRLKKGVFFCSNFIIVVVMQALWLYDVSTTRPNLWWDTSLIEDVGTHSSMEQRALSLLHDPRVTSLEEHRVLCGRCSDWVQLKEKYCIHSWNSHISKCEPIRTSWYETRYE